MVQTDIDIQFDQNVPAAVQSHVFRNDRRLKSFARKRGGRLIRISPESEHVCHITIQGLSRPVKKFFCILGEQGWRFRFNRDIAPA